jgi:hypothetical protein
MMITPLRNGLEETPRVVVPLPGLTLACADRRVLVVNRRPFTRVRTPRNFAYKRDRDLVEDVLKAPGRLEILLRRACCVATPAMRSIALLCR